MSVVVTFLDFRPPARFDGIPWAQAQVGEAASPSGPFAVIDTIALAVDPDPSTPQAFSFTTNQGTADGLWYRVIFIDGAGDTSEPTPPLQNISGVATSEPCTSWLTGEDVALCCDVETSDGSIFDDAAQQAQELLFELSGRQFPGICSQTVRPCRTNCGCAWQVLSRGHIVWNPMLDEGWWTCNGDSCGCRPRSRVLLAGHVQSIIEVKIDGDVVDPDTYQVVNHRWLVRMRDPADPDTALTWPGCQNLDLEDDQDGTFSVTYSYGVDPPRAGVAAAVELACEIYKACDDQPCALPKGVVRLARQGVVMEKTPFVSWGYETGRTGRLQKGWSTGMAQVDAFLNAYNPNGLIRRPVFWSPATVGQYAQAAGT